MPDIPSPEARVARFLEQITLDPRGDDAFRGVPMPMGPGLFGGLLLAQAVMAAGRTDVRGNAHSLHAAFLRGGKHEDLTYEVRRLRDTRSFSTRDVHAMQGDDLVFQATIAFTVPDERGLAHQLARPEAPPPETQPYWWNTMSGSKPDADPEKTNARWLGRHPLDVRSAEVRPQVPPPERLPHRAAWLCPVAPFPDDTLVHAAAIAYLSDFGLVTTVSNAYNAGEHLVGGVSLDHSLWWHRPPRLDGWVLYVSDSPVAHHGRGLAWGGMWTESGDRIASVAQEGYYRAATAQGASGPDRRHDGRAPGPAR